MFVNVMAGVGCVSESGFARSMRRSAVPRKPMSGVSSVSDVLPKCIDPSSFRRTASPSSETDNALKRFRAKTPLLRPMRPQPPMHPLHLKRPMPRALRSAPITIRRFWLPPKRCCRRLTLRRLAGSQRFFRHPLPISLSRSRMRSKTMTRRETRFSLISKRAISRSLAEEAPDLSHGEESATALRSVL